ncbi:DUF1622 domain-containing protein [Aestuariivirga sp.]|uniref:DUF1622 domain-containing protein n=1 Tax=Aestuariivirga sp. TaxID=2650926 RepID=UPI0025C63B9F|nr:DUF1622 domain-containing protein [Aestuariivirga sp.]MCA3554547.1 DUF1622 domain-containing protein [Aestuariivirga sp.]
MSHELIKELTLLLSTITEGAAAFVIAVAVIEAAFRTLWLIPQSFSGGEASSGHEAKEDVRLRLGRWLALALEFLLAADILRTAVAPSWSEIGELAAIAAIRTALNFFLQLEIDRAEQRKTTPPEARAG